MTLLKSLKLVCNFSLIFLHHEELFLHKLAFIIGETRELNLESQKI